MPQSNSPYPSGWTLRTPSLASRGRCLAVVTIPVSEGTPLSHVQLATRELCRSTGLAEPVVFEAVIAVTELAHRLFVERARNGSLELSAVRRADAVGLEVVLTGAADEVDPTPISLFFALAGTAVYS
jgi:hypothetical protein